MLSVIYLALSQSLELLPINHIVLGQSLEPIAMSKPILLWETQWQALLEELQESAWQLSQQPTCFKTPLSPGTKTEWYFQHCEGTDGCHEWWTCWSRNRQIHKQLWRKPRKSLLQNSISTYICDRICKNYPYWHNNWNPIYGLKLKLHSSTVQAHQAHGYR